METILRDLAGFFSWYLTISVVGLLAFPLVFKYLPALRDRGYTFARLIGLLAWGFLFWMLSSLGVLENTLAGQVLALVLLVLVSGLTLRKSGLREIITWLRNNRKLVIVIRNRVPGLIRTVGIHPIRQPGDHRHREAHGTGIHQRDPALAGYAPQ